MRTYTQDQVREMFNKRKGAKSLRVFAREVGVTDTYVSFVLSGRQLPGPKILQFLGLRSEKQITYTYFEAANGKRS